MDNYETMDEKERDDDKIRMGQILSAVSVKLIMGKMLGDLYGLCENQKLVRCEELEVAIDEVSEALRFESLCISEAIKNLKKE